MVAAPAQTATIEISTSTGSVGSALSPEKTTGVTAISELISEPSTWAIVALGLVALGYAGGFRRNRRRRLDTLWKSLRIRRRQSVIGEPDQKRRMMRGPRDAAALRGRAIASRCPVARGIFTDWQSMMCNDAFESAEEQARIGGAPLWRCHWSKSQPQP
jgi:hypothetical protein